MMAGLRFTLPHIHFYSRRSSPLTRLLAAGSCISVTETEDVLFQSVGKTHIRMPTWTLVKKETEARPIIIIEKGKKSSGNKREKKKIVCVSFGPMSFICSNVNILPHMPTSLYTEQSNNSRGRKRENAVAKANVAK